MPCVNAGLRTRTAVLRCSERSQSTTSLSPRSTKDGWYRYHPQFQACLRKQLHLHRTPAGYASFMRVPQGWYGDHGYITESLHAYLAADLPACAADQLELALGDLYYAAKRCNCSSTWSACCRPPWWPAAGAADGAVLAGGIAQPVGGDAQVQRGCGTAARKSCCASRPDASADGLGRNLRCPQLLSRLWRTLADQQAAAEQALARLPADHIQGRGFALISLARIYRWQGRLPAAERLLEQRVG
jgi:hypothetical protein